MSIHKKNQLEKMDVCSEKTKMHSKTNELTDNEYEECNRRLQLKENQVLGCRRARELISSYIELSVTKLMINKLQVAAYTAIEDYKIRSIDDLCDTLRQTFGPHHTYEHY